jgi:galactose mutarotase-like enzyme
MPNLQPRDSGENAVGTLLVLADESSESRVEIAPQRGALVTSFKVKDRELLYLEPATLGDATKNVRGGIPVLFPSPGKLTSDLFTRDGRTGSMKQHGFARNMPWMPETTSDAARAEVTLRLDSNEQTRAQYPWDFSAALTFSLRGTRLTIQHRVHNT